MLVEDNEVNALIAGMMLEEAGIKVKKALTGRDALRVLAAELAEGAAQTELVLMDCLMPEMDGFAATQALRRGEAGKAWQTIPVIALTANAINEERQKCLDAGMDDFLSKPIQAHVLLAKIAEYLCPAEATDSAIIAAETESAANLDLTPQISWQVDALRVQLRSDGKCHSSIATVVSETDRINRNRFRGYVGAPRLARHPAQSAFLKGFIWPVALD